MGEWTLFSNHGHVLVCLAKNNEARLRDVAAEVGITERAVQNILRELQQAGLVGVSKHGRCNHYQINSRKHLRHALESHCTVGKLLNLLIQDDEDEPAQSAETLPAKKEPKPAPPKPVDIKQQKALPVAAKSPPEEAKAIKPAEPVRQEKPAVIPDPVSSPEQADEKVATTVDARVAPPGAAPEKEQEPAVEAPVSKPLSARPEPAKPEHAKSKKAASKKEDATKENDTPSTQQGSLF